MSQSIEASILYLVPDALIWAKPVFDGDKKVIDFEIGYSNKAADEGINHPKGSLTGLQVLRDGVPSPQNAIENFNHLLDVYLSNEEKEFSFLAAYANRRYETQRQPVAGGVMSVTRDRGAQREAEKREQEARRRADSIVRNSPNGIVFYTALRDDDGSIRDFELQYFNDKSNELIGISGEQRQSMTFREVLRFLDIENSFPRYIDVVEKGQPLQRDFYAAAVNKWITSSVVKFDSGFLGLLSDVTELKKAEALIQKEAERFETVVNTSKAGMFTVYPVYDHAGEITDFRFGIVNQAVASYIGENAETLKGSLASIYFPAYKSNGLFEIYKKCYLEGTPSNFDFHYEDGYDVFFNIDVLKIDQEVLVTFTDFTALKRLQRDLETKVDELKRSNANLEEFAHAASHDLKEPIRKVQIFSSRLRNSLGEKVDEQEAHLFNRVENATERMRLLVDDLLQFSQVSQSAIEMEEVDLNKKLRLVLADLELAIEDKNAQVEVGQLPVLMGHKRQLQQLFQNLVSNALKYNRPGVPPEIQISSRQVQGGELDMPLTAEEQLQQYHLIEVRDNGIGFDQQYHDRIFQMFQRLHGRSEYAGTGIGLSIARRVVENHKGRIWANSEVNRGSSFYVLLPA